METQSSTSDATPDTWARSLQILGAKGLRFGAFIDVGSADGYHGLAIRASGILPGAAIANIDANPLYEPTLRRIHEMIGGHYRICAVADRPGQIEFHSSAHPYWASAAGVDDKYWPSINQLLGQSTMVPCETLDALVAGMGLTGPYVVKLDIQGLEAAALRGAGRTMADTGVLICEVIVPEFHALHSLIVSLGFSLFDLTNIHRTQAGTLGWLDAVYLHRNFAYLIEPEAWAREHNDEVIRLQDQRRQAVLQGIDTLLSRMRS